MATADVTVMGGGIFGLACAWACARRGASVRVVERDRIGAGSSGGLVGALAPHVPEQWNPKKQFQLESLLMSEAFWEDVREVSGQDPLYARSGRVQPLADSDAVARARVREEEAAVLWQGRALWRVTGAAEFAGWGPDTPTGLVVHDTLSARLCPRAGLATLSAAIRAKAGEIMTGEAEPSGAVIWATGAAGLQDLSAAFGRNLGGAEKGQAALLRHDAREAPQIFAEGLFIVPHGDGTVAIGSTSEREFAEADTTDAALEALIDRARTVCPALAEAPVVERWAGLRPRAKSRAPMLGAWPGRPGHFIANGGFKIGFGIAPKVAEVMADLVLDGRDAIPDGFRVEDSL
ncbi:NAD(P)/FAD-dependent oxidoreductase [Ostreiculturibacter nitratireducens]|uniref:NAD(P)/FAD-dependent oxidoreductase n=1 Tax=Ostreiculturibacter nitratireducens TaxID=3075226 RepID=UPI0031B5A8A8